MGAYIEVASRGWSLKTQEKEASKLNSVLPSLTKYGFDPDNLYKDFSAKGMAPYTIKIRFIRLKCMYDFCVRVGIVDPGPNPFGTYMKHTAPNKFKTANVYSKKEVPVTYDEARKLIESMQDDVKNTLRFLLKTGLRISELEALNKSADGSWYVKGKGGKFRTIMDQPPERISSKSKVQTALARIGLTPHHLRKLVATKLVEKGLDINELTQVMGWSSITTAQSYLQKANFNELKTRIGGILV